MVPLTVPWFFPALGFPRKYRVCALFSHFYFIVLDCGIIIVCLIGLVIFAHLTTQREKVCVLYRHFSQHSGIKSLVYIFLGDTLVLVYDG